MTPSLPYARIQNITWITDLRARGRVLPIFHTSTLVKKRSSATLEALNCSQSLALCYPHHGNKHRSKLLQFHHHTHAWSQAGPTNFPHPENAASAPTPQRSRLKICTKITTHIMHTWGRFTRSIIHKLRELRSGARKKSSIPTNRNESLIQDKPR